ncbi:hypothetical protein CDV31_001803 [Fusarium ambrosium]|uniref:Uncharacterized protein n=1 Tax=Fusarium ambrosium TaxID=131363 RepID=A0A428UYL4_9HYPO|nr:hypothetical protein CDV31_001803 [Fusarium ambrosium]
MLLNQRNVDIFFATIPAFAASLPPAPDRDKALGDDVTLALTNSIVNLRFEFTRLRDSFSIEWAAIELPKKDCAEVNVALEDILDMLDSLVDGSIGEKYQDLGNHFPRLESLKREILDRNPALGLDGLRQVPNDVLRYVRYVEPRGHAAARYRRLADGARQFNDTMDRVFSRHIGIAEAGSVEIFHRDRNSNADDLDLDKSDLNEIYAARKVSSAAKKIARILTMSICGNIFVPGNFDGDVEGHAKNNKSFILELGALLWELFFQQKVNITEEDEEDESDEVSLFNALNREEEIWRKKCVDAACLDIISNCLEAWCEDEVDEEKLRATIHRTVFRPLREYRVSYIYLLSNDAARASPPSFLHNPSMTLEGGTMSLSSIYLSNTIESESYKSLHLSSLGSTQLPVISESIEFCQEVSLLTPTNGTITDSLAWIAKFKYATQHLASLSEGVGSKPIKVAILDTGLDIADPYFSGAGIDRVDDWRDLWHDCLGESSTPVDDDKGRHGTALACLLLQLAPEATVYVLRVAKNSSGLDQAQEAIGTAILHAVTSWDVDIISMSFGFNSEAPPIRNAIVQAERLKGDEILFFAAANNDGLNEPEMSPAFFESVISARGTECNGEFIQQYNPKSWSHKSGTQYGTLARDVPYNWPVPKPAKSGCSVSTPILAAIAALLISFVDNQKHWDSERHAIRTRRGIVAVFNFMAQDVGSFNGRLYVAPWQLYEQRRQPRYLSPTLWGAFLEKIRLGTTAQQERIKNGLFTMESLETIYLSEDPSPEEIKARCNDPLVREYMRLDSLLCSPVYMVTGIKVAKGFKLEGEKSSSTSVEFEGGGEVSQEASIGVNTAATKKERIADEFESDGDIVFAYQLMKITPKGWRKEKRLKTDEYQHRQAFLVDEEEAEKEVEVEIGEVVLEDVEELKGVQVADSVEGRVAFV